MSGEPVFLSVSQVKTLHQVALERHGGQVGLRDANAFESAVMQPQNVWFYARGDLFEVAAAYAFNLAESQAFIDGNKRTGMAAALVFLDLNGRPVPEEQHADDELYAAMIAIAGRRIGKPELAALLRRLCAA